MTETQSILMLAVTGSIADLKAIMAEIKRKAEDDTHDNKVRAMHFCGTIKAIGKLRFGFDWQD
jgi:hypothetical protein